MDRYFLTAKIIGHLASKHTLDEIVIILFRALCFRNLVFKSRLFRFLFCHTSNLVTFVIRDMIIYLQ